MWKTCQLIMLSANTKAEVGEYAIMLNSTTGINPYLSHGIIQREQGFNIKCNKQHLYITSDEKIKEEDWFIILDGTSSIHQCKSVSLEYIDFKDVNGFCSKPSVCKKIIATTEKSLNLPKIPQFFIENFVKEYNTGNVIKEVSVKYETKLERVFSHSGNRIQEKSDPFLKVNPKDNTITIRKVKDSFSKEEVIELLRNFNEDFGKLSLYGDFKNTDIPKFNKWIKNNL